MRNSTWREKPVDVKLDKTVMFCESCMGEFPRWDIDIVEPEPIVFEIDRLDPTIELNFACPECVTLYALQPLQTEKAQTFREKNEKLRQALEPQTIN